jgi:hypothetical protein
MRRNGRWILPRSEPFCVDLNHGKEWYASEIEKSYFHRLIRRPARISKDSKFEGESRVQQRYTHQLLLLH